MFKVLKSVEKSFDSRYVLARQHFVFKREIACSTHTRRSGLNEKFRMSLFSYFKPVNGNSLCGEALQTETGKVSETQVCVARDLNQSILEKTKPAKRQIVPEKIKREVGFHAKKHRIATAPKWAEENYKDYIAKRENVRDWQNQYCQIYVEKDSTVEKTIFFMAVPDIQVSVS